MIVAAAILGLGYLGLAVQNQLSVLAGGVENKPKSPWDIFFEGLQSVLDDENEAEDIGIYNPGLYTEKQYGTVWANKVQPLIDSLAASSGVSDVYYVWEEHEQEYERMEDFYNAIIAKYVDPNDFYGPWGKRGTLWAYSFDATISEKAEGYLEQLKAITEGNETAFDKVVALSAILRDIEATDDLSNNINEYSYYLRDGYCTTEKGMLKIYSRYYMYKAYHPDWEPGIPYF
jgi:hypothetical protein